MQALTANSVVCDPQNSGPLSAHHLLVMVTFFRLWLGIEADNKGMVFSQSEGLIEDGPLETCPPSNLPVSFFFLPTCFAAVHMHLHDIFPKPSLFPRNDQASRYRPCLIQKRLGQDG
jgi:hypothetical protein